MTIVDWPGSSDGGLAVTPVHIIVPSGFCAPQTMSSAAKNGIRASIARSVVPP